MLNSFSTRAFVSAIVWLGALSIWLVMISLFSDKGTAVEIRHIVAAISALADKKLCVAQLLGVAVIACIVGLSGGKKYSEAHVQKTHELFLAEALTICINFAIVFGMAAILSVVALFLKDSSLPEPNVTGSIAMMLINWAIAYAVWLKIK